MKKIYDGLIPFDVGKDNCQLHYPEDWGVKELVWKDNRPFTARLQFSNTFARGRSAAYFFAVLCFVDCADKEYAQFLEGKGVSLFMVDLADIISTTQEIHYGLTSRLDLVFSKRGQNYGLTLQKGS